jgi:hypothetical protein
MAQTVVPTAQAPGKGGSRPVYALAPRVCIFAHYEMNFDTSNYTVGGEDISSIWADFTEVLHISVEQRDTNTPADNRLLRVDYTNKKLLIYINDANSALITESGAADQGVVTASLLAFGYK